MEENQDPPKIRNDWYQTESHVFVNILCKNVKGDVNVKYGDRSVGLSFALESGVKHDIVFNLLHEISPAGCSHKITPSKIEMKLKKKEGYRWEKLECDEGSAKPAEQVADKTPSYPSSSLKSKDWDKVVVDITKNDNDHPEGDAALHALFQKIYSEGSDEVRKAMNKSFFESAGTVLSTNWGEVEKDKVTVKPPDGVEFKKWDS